MCSIHTCNRSVFIQKLREEYPAGTKIKLTHMDGEPQMPPGLEGKVNHVDDIGQIHVDWENGSCLALVIGVDTFTKI